MAPGDRSRTKRRERDRVGPGRRVPAGHTHGYQARGRNRSGGLLGSHPAEVPTQVPEGPDPQPLGRKRGEPGVARRIVQLTHPQARGDRPLGEVIDPPPGDALDAHDGPDREQSLERDLLRRPVPPDVLRPGLLRARAPEIRRGERPAGRKLRDDPRHRPGVVRPIGMGPARAAAPARRQIRPELDREDAHRMGQRLEGSCRPAPVGVLDRRTTDRAKPGVDHQLMRPGEHRDRIQLDRAEAMEERGNAPHRRPADDPLGVEREPARVRCGQLDRGRSHYVVGAGAHQWAR